MIVSKPRLAMKPGSPHIASATQAQTNFLQFLMYRQAFVEERHPHLWSNLYLGYKEANLSILKAGFEQKSHLLGGIYNVLSSQPNILNELDFKRLDLETIMPRAIGRFHLDMLKRAIHLQAECKIDWITEEYEYTITLKRQEGVYKGWLHQYWPGTSNGNVWLVINPATAIFYMHS